MALPQERKGRMTELDLKVPISDIALGVFLGWFLIKLFLKMHGGVKAVAETIAKYFEAKDTAEKILKDMKK